MKDKHKVTPDVERELIKIADQLPNLQKTREDGTTIMETVKVKRKGCELPKGTLCDGKPVKANKKYITTFKRPVYIDKLEHLKELFREGAHERVQQFIDTIDQAITKANAKNESSTEAAPE